MVQRRTTNKKTSKKRTITKRGKTKRYSLNYSKIYGKKK